MQKTVELSNSAIELLNDLSKKYNVTPSEVISGLLIGYNLNSLNELTKVAEKPKNRLVTKLALTKIFKDDLHYKTEKRFIKRYGCNFEYVSRFGFSNYINEEID